MKNHNDLMLEVVIEHNWDRGKASIIIKKDDCTIAFNTFSEIIIKGKIYLSMDNLGKANYSFHKDMKIVKFKHVELDHYKARLAFELLCFRFRFRGIQVVIT